MDRRLSPVKKFLYAFLACTLIGSINHMALAGEGSGAPPPDTTSSVSSTDSPENVISVGQDTKLDEAIANAPEGAVLEITGTHSLGSSPITIKKSITLRAGAGGGVIQATQRADAHIIFEEKGKNFILGSENDEPVLRLDGVTVKAAAGSFEARKGWLIDNKGGLDINGADAVAKISGGTITNGRTAETYGYHVGAIQVRNNAVVTEISGGSFTGAATAMAVDSGSVVKKISGGTFTRGMNSSPWDTVRVKYATIEDITGGTFTSNYDAALRVEEGGRIKHISGGTFHTETADQYLAYLQAFRLDYGAALSIYTGVNDTTGADFTGVDKISGGDFSGTHAIFMLGNNAQPYAEKSMVTIGEISGGTFTSTLEREKDKTGRRIKKDAVLLGRQSYIGRISGGTFHTKFASPALHLAYTPGNDANTRPRATVSEISGGTFISDQSYSLDIEKGLIDTISGGEFYSANTNGVSTSSSGSIRQITGGKFSNNYSPTECSSWNENVPLIKASYYATPNDSKPQGLLLEPGLTSDIGKGRYWTKLCTNSKYGIYNYKVVPPNAVLPEGYVMAGYNRDYTFRVVKADDGTTDFVMNKRSLYFKKNADGEILPASISSVNNEWYAENGYEKLEKPIYALTQKYRTEDVTLKEDHQKPDGTTEVRHYRYLMKTPTVTFNVNAPSVANDEAASGAALRSARAANGSVLPHTGEAPETMTIKPFAYDSYANSISEKNSQVFKVPGNDGNLAIEGYAFRGFNTQADGSGVTMREGEYYAMPSANVTLYSQWEKITRDEPESKEVTRTITYVDATDKSKQIADPVVQKVTLTRTNVRNLETDEVTLGKWSTAKFEAVDSPSVENYGKPDKASAPEMDVNGDTADSTVQVEYPQGVKDESESKTVMRTITYVDAVTKDSVHASEVQKVTLTRTNVRNLVTDEVTPGAWSAGTFEAVTSPSVEKYGAPDIVSVPEADAVSDTEVTVTYPQGTENVPEEKTVTRTITYVDETNQKEIATHVIQSVTLKRTNVRNLVTGAVKEGVWSTGTFNEVVSPSLDNYGKPDTVSVPELAVTGESKDSTVVVTYPQGMKDESESKTVMRTISYVDAVTKDSIHASEVQKVTLTRTNVRNLVTDEVKLGQWSTGKLEAVQSPSVEKYGAPDKTSIPEMDVTYEAADTEVIVAYPQGMKDESESKTVMRTISYVDAVTKDAIHDSVVQQVTLTRTNVRNLVTNLLTEGQWSTGKFEAVESPMVEKYAAPDTASVDASDVTSQTESSTVVVTYPHGMEELSEEKTLTRTIIFVDEVTGKQIADSIVQKAMLKRTNVRNLVTNAAAEGEWSTAVLPEVQVQSVEGYESPAVTRVPEVQVNGQSEDHVIRVTFSPAQKVVKTGTAVRSEKKTKKTPALAHTGVDLTGLVTATVLLLVAGVAVMRKRSAK